MDNKAKQQLDELRREHQSKRAISEAEVGNLEPLYSYLRKHDHLPQQMRQLIVEFLDGTRKRPPNRPPKDTTITKQAEMAAQVVEYEVVYGLSTKEAVDKVREQFGYKSTSTVRKAMEKHR